MINFLNKTDDHCHTRFASWTMMITPLVALFLISAPLFSKEGEETGGWQHPYFQERMFEAQKKVTEKTKKKCAEEDLRKVTSSTNFFYKPFSASLQNARNLRLLQADYVRYQAMQKSEKLEENLTLKEISDLEELQKKYATNIIPGLGIGEKVYAWLPEAKTLGTTIANDFREHYLAWTLCGFALLQGYSKIRTTIRQKRSLLSPKILATATRDFKTRATVWKKNTVGLLPYIASEVKMAYQVLAED